MVRYVVSPQIPPVFLSDAAREAGEENPAFTDWEEQDSLLCTWILSTVSASLLARFVRLRHSHEVWDMLFTLTVILKCALVRDNFVLSCALLPRERVLLLNS